MITKLTRPFYAGVIIVSAAFSAALVCPGIAIASDINTGNSRVSLPEVYVLGIANPFPTLYVFNDEGDLLLQGKGKDDPLFDFDLSKVADRPLPETESVKKVQEYFEVRNKRAKRTHPSSEYYFYYFTLDSESFGSDCEICTNIENKLTKNIGTSGHPAYLEVISVTKQ